MDYIMVTFQIEKEAIDLKLPLFVEVGELLKNLEEVLNIRINEHHRIQAEPLGRILENSKTLEEENVMQGSLLTLI